MAATFDFEQTLPREEVSFGLLGDVGIVEDGVATAATFVFERRQGERSGCRDGSEQVCFNGRHN